MSPGIEVALARQKRALRDWVRALGSGSHGATVLELDGVTAALVPACPERSICNSVTYTDAATLSASIDRLAGAYEGAGIAAWTVWTPDLDGAAIEVLEGAGHRLDGEPRAMSCDLRTLAEIELGDLDWDAAADPAELGAINDLAYGLPSGAGMAPGLAEPPPEVTLYRARVQGETACVLGTIDHERDLGIYFVATRPERQGMGLASRLMGATARAALRRGMRTSSLQASPMGLPIYRRLGYGEDFVLRMYERRG